MKKTAKNIAYLVIIAIAVYIIQIYNAAKKLTFGLGKIEGLKIRSGAVEFILNLRATNGDGVAIPLTSINVDNYFGNSILGKAILEESIFISGRTTTNIPLRITIPLTDLIVLIPEIKTAISSKTIFFALKGTVSAVGITAPVNQSYLINLSNIF